LVLIAGAAVILWFGSRLNSWILGGLIGGLASLLLSIPISLALFAYFARQHDEREQYRQVTYKRLRSQRSTYSAEERDADSYDAEYGLVDREIAASVEEYDQSLPAASDWLDGDLGFSYPPSRRLPPASRRATGNRSTRRLSTPYGPQQRQARPGNHQVSDTEEEYRTRRTAALRRTAYPGLPGSPKHPFRSRFRSDALRTARLEAVRQNVEENEIFLEDYDEPSSSPAPPSRRGREPRTDHLSPDSFSEDLHRPLQRRAPYTYEDDEIRQEMARYREAPRVRRSTRYLRDRNNQDEAQ
jgi:hypothetical protein